MKYKIGDRVYFAGDKYEVTNVHPWGVRIRNWKTAWNVTARSVKPIVRCGNECT